MLIAGKEHWEYMQELDEKLESLFEREEENAARGDYELDILKDEVQND